MSLRSLTRPWCLLALALAGWQAAAGELQAGTRFLVVRKQLLAQHWQPLDVHRHDRYEFVGTEQALRAHAIPEVESCAMDRAICIFNYRKGRQCLRLFTNGEQVADMTLARWDRVCPEKP